jgi:hypothetical protein
MSLVARCHQSRLQFFVRYWRRCGHRNALDPEGSAANDLSPTSVRSLANRAVATVQMYGRLMFV